MERLIHETDTRIDQQDLSEQQFMQYLASEYSKGAIIHGLPKDSYIHYCSTNNIQQLSQLSDPAYHSK